MAARGVPRPGCAADPRFGRAGRRGGRAWLRRPDCDPPRDRPPDATAYIRDRIDSYGNTGQSWATTGSSAPPTMPLRSTVPNPAMPAFAPPCLTAAALPRSMAGVALRSASRSRRHKRAAGGRTNLRGAAPPDTAAAPATISCARRPGRRVSRWHRRPLNTTADYTRRCC